MAIFTMPTGKRPTVQEYENGIAVWAEAEGEPVGFLLGAEVASAVALDMLATARTLQDNHPTILSVRSVELLEAIEVDEDVAARLVVEADGAAFAFDISATNLAELAAGLAVASRKIG